MGGEIRVEEVTEPFDGLVPAMSALVKQLSRSSPPPSAAEVEEIVRSPACHLLLARDADGAIVLYQRLGFVQRETNVYRFEAPD